MKTNERSTISESFRALREKSEASSSFDLDLAGDQVLSLALSLAHTLSLARSLSLALSLAPLRPPFLITKAAFVCVYFFIKIIRETQG